MEEDEAKARMAGCKSQTNEGTGKDRRITGLMGKDETKTNKTDESQSGRRRSNLQD